MTTDSIEQNGEEYPVEGVFGVEDIGIDVAEDGPEDLAEEAPPVEAPPVEEHRWEDDGGYHVRTCTTCACVHAGHDTECSSCRDARARLLERPPG